jgi:hypothetical protein
LCESQAGYENVFTVHKSNGWISETTLNLSLA